ncbi:tetratricopeptide repeat protein [Salinactinospora qingdaonensis]|uniref:Tetratricopeptide repeat-containing protein n=1 Tax=Salinactinospora qingdaonensis TaxID=702744 RepID=A0ABP7GHE7_9ACTN
MGWRVAGGWDRRRAGKLLDQGATARSSDDLATAVTRYQEAASIVRKLAQAQPRERDHPQQLGSTLYTLGQVLLEAGSPRKAVSALEEAERSYRAWAALTPDSEELLASRLADVQLRRARAHSFAGYLASALVDAQRSVMSYMDRFTGAAEDPLALDVARVLAHNAVISATCGDPDVAVASAEEALRIYLREAARINGDLSLRALHTTTFTAAAHVAEVVHTAHGRPESAKSAAEFTAQLPPPASPPPSVEQIRQSPTLREALEQAGDTHLRDRLVAPATDGTILTSVHRCDPQVAPTMATGLAELAEQIVDTAPRAGLRLGLEANTLYATAAQLHASQQRHQLAEFGPPWARMLLRCSQASEASGSRALALDLAGWMAATVNGLGPNTFLPSVRPLARDCMEWHATLLAESGDTAGADRAAHSASLFDGAEDPLA